jgi:hypothetical protein
MTCKTLLLTASAAAAFTASSHAGLVAYYSFDSDFTDAEATTGGGTITGATGSITAVAGDVAVGTGAARMDGTGPMSLAETVTFTSTDSWSVAFWGKRDSDADFRSGMVVSNSNTSFIWTPDNDSATVVNGLRVRSSINANGNGPNQEDTDYDNDLLDQTIFNHWAVVADGSGATKNIKIYLNGDEVLSKDDALVDNVFSLFGGWGGGAANNYDGVIDELYIYDEALDASAVAALVPEPGSLALLGLGGLLIARRRR